MSVHLEWEPVKFYIDLKRWCNKCQGCGRVTDNEQELPWHWNYYQSLTAVEPVRKGLVGKKCCPACGGSGQRADELRRAAAAVEG